MPAPDDQDLESCLALALDAELKDSDVSETLGPGYAAAPKIDFGAAIAAGKGLVDFIGKNTDLLGKLLGPDVADALNKTETAAAASAAALAAILRVAKRAA